MTVRSATAWCDGYTVPLLVPLTGWLPAPLPSQIRTMTVSGTGPIRDICVAPSKQHLILATKSGDVQLWHIMSNSLEHTFKGKLCYKMSAIFFFVDLSFESYHSYCKLVDRVENHK